MTEAKKRAPKALPTVGELAEAAQAERAAAAEALVPPNGSVGEVIEGTIELAEAQVTHLFVRARRDGFRRCGRAWPAVGVEVPVDAFSDEDVERLLADPNLLVELICRPLPEIE